MLHWCFLFQFGNLKLPSEAFASRYEEPEGMLNLAAPTFGNKNFTLNSTIIIDCIKLYEHKQGI